MEYFLENNQNNIGLWIEWDYDNSPKIGIKKLMW